jgi:hypothetical protein
MDPNQLLADLVVVADNAMYEAKRAGGDQVVIRTPATDQQR